MRVVAGLLLAGVIGLSSQGCEVHVSSNGGSSDDCEARSYDLGKPPSRSDLGFEAGKAFVDVSCDDGFELSLTLPAGTTTSLIARRVNADSYSAANPQTDPPTTMDVHSVGLDVDEALQLATRVAGELGIDATAALQSWRQQVEGPARGDSVDTPFLRSSLGYLTVEMQVQHLGVSGTNFMHLILSWG